MSKTIKDKVTLDKKKNKDKINNLKKKKALKNKFNNGIVFIKKLLTRVNITYFVLGCLDIILVIYLARQNIVNYAVVLDEEIFVSKTRYLLFGRNYVNLIVTFFFGIYICLVNKFFLHKDNNKKFLGWLMFILVVLNIVLFIIFTKKVY